MDKLALAYEFASNCHKGQKDRALNDYITHPLWVSNHLSGLNEKIVGMLHDTVEDSFATLDEIEDRKSVV